MMPYQWLRTPKSFGITLLLLSLLFIVACGSAAEPSAAPDTGADKAAVVPTPPSLAPISGGKPTSAPAANTGADKAAAPTVMPEPVAQPSLPAQLFGGHIPMATYSNPTKRSLYWGGSGLNGLGPSYNGLVEWDPEQPDSTVIRGDLAESWEVLDGGQTLVFHLKEARWHDGVPFTAEDVVFSMDNMVCPDCFEVSKGRPSTSVVNLIAGAYENGNARAIDDRTVEATLKYAEGDFLIMLTDNNAAISPRHTVLEQGKLQEVYKPENLNGSGPFIRVGLTPDVSME